jgi:four helix bundle suffix protein
MNSGRDKRTGHGPGAHAGGEESILAPHGGYRKLKSFQMAQLVYDLTVRFCDRYIDKRSRTHDQMVQAARSGVQNIAEGSKVSATSKKMEMKLTQVARASQDELKLDYEDFLRHRGLPCWERDDPLRQALVDARLQTADEVALWVQRTARQIWERNFSGQGGQGGQRRQESKNDPGAASSLSVASTRSIPSTPSTASSLYPWLSANAILALATVAGYLMDRQIQSQARYFEEHGGFTERLYRVRTAKRRRA